MKNFLIILICVVAAGILWHSNTKQHTKSQDETIPEQEKITTKTISDTWNILTINIMDVSDKQGTVTFDGNLASLYIDCNQINATVDRNDTKITFTDIFMTRMYCEDSIEDEFITTLNNVRYYEQYEQKENSLILQDENKNNLIALEQ